MSTPLLRASLMLWQRRERAAKARHTAAVKRGDKAGIARHGQRLRESRTMVARRAAQLAENGRPRIITARELGLTFQDVFGGVGQVIRWTGHYSAGPRARTAAEGVARARSFHALHKSQDWGGCSYSALVCDDGTLILLNPAGRKGAHVAGNNTGNIGINCPGTTGDKPTAAQAATVRWYVANSHTRKVPAAHRQPVDLRRVKALVHSDMNATACPGSFEDLFRKAA